MAERRFGIIGLGVMGRNFLLNVARGGVPCVGFDVDPDKRAEAMREGEGLGVAVPDSLESFFASLAEPRSVMLFVPAEVVRGTVDQCLPLLAPGDLLIDGGNSHFPDTESHAALAATVGAEFLGVGVSGGEEGARNGACMMAGGGIASFERVRPIFEVASAKVEGEACAALVGSGSAGHFVKMVHNGIEYALMEIIVEAFDLMRRMLGMTADEMSAVFAEWNEGRLDSFLVEITRDILKKRDSSSGVPLVELILDKAAQKGTGKWTSQAAMDLGIPIPTLDCAVSMRQVSSLKEVRTAVAVKLGPVIDAPMESERDPVLADLEAAVYGSFLSAYAQGMSLLAAASVARGYGIDLGEVARIWRGGCIVRSGILEDLRKAFASSPSLPTLLMDEGFAAELASALPAWRRTAVRMTGAGIPSMGISSALNYVEAMSTERLPANLLQAQRDLFGAHTYERTDLPGRFHTEDWREG